jgi:hypothetical protein
MKAALIAFALGINTSTFAGSVLYTDNGSGLHSFSGTDENGDYVRGTAMDLGGGHSSQRWTDSDGETHSGTGMSLGGDLWTFEGRRD